MSPDSSAMLSGCWAALVGPWATVRGINCTVVRETGGTGCVVFGGGSCDGVLFSGVNWLGLSEESSVAVGVVAEGGERCGYDTI